MADMEPESRRAHFGVFTAFIETGQLYRGGLHVKIQELPFRFLLALFLQPGVLVTREKLRDELWSSDTFVDFDRGINTAVTKLRQALGDSADNPRFVETVGRRGYRFIAPVQFEGGAAETEAQPGAAPSIMPAKAMERTVEATPAIGRRSSGLNLRLQPIFFALAGVVLVAVATGSMVHRIRSSNIPVLTSLLVLPLENVSGDPSQDSFGDGITDELITAMAKLPNMTVISRTSAMHFKNSNLSLPEIARQLGVHAVLEGTVKRSGNRVRITAQLIDAATDHHLWAEVFESDMADVLHVQEKIAQNIAMSAAGELSAREKSSTASYRPVNPESFDAYLEGRIHWAKRSPDSIPLAVKEFERAIALDPNFAPAYSGLADALLVMPVVSTQGDFSLYEKARKAARRAIELDPTSAEAHTSLASADEAEWHFDEAEAEFRRAIQLNPNYATAHQWFAEELSIVGKHEEAIAEIQRAIALDPLSAIVQHQAGQVYQEARQYDQAIECYRQAIALDSAFDQSRAFLLLALKRKHDGQKFIAAVRELRPQFNAQGQLRFMKLGPINPMVENYRHKGDAAIRDYMAEYVAQAPRPDFYRAMAYTEAGDSENAIRSLAKAVRQRDFEVMQMLNYAEFDSLHSDRRFQQLVQLVGLRPQKSGSPQL